MATEITQVTKTGEWYTVKGRVDGRETSVDVPAFNVGQRSDTEAKALFQRYLQTCDRATGEKGNERAG